ncbi:tetratricopeptide repeat protein [Actinomadura luteofluorescens]|uniref:tetratricopeptide repeat protein n=1 Tax=Actinomadura luteofluorescens TaxID=46163 RepID=UPI0036287684
MSPDDRRLDEVRDEGREITTVFEISYRGLPSSLGDAFRAFGQHPGPDLTAHAAAAALGRPVREAERILEELFDRHLITEPVSGRYRFHDLVHDYVRRLTRETDPEEERRRIVHRILDFYLAAAEQADRLISPHRAAHDLRLVHTPPELPSPRDEPEATAWFATEYHCLLNAAAEAERAGLPGHVAGFARVLAGYLESQGHWEVAERLHSRAITALRDSGDGPSLARALSDRSLVRFRSGEYDSALEDAERALAVFRSAGERHGEADILDHMGLIHWHLSRFPEALAHGREALAIHRSLGDRRGEAKNLDYTAIFLEYRGRYREAEQLRLRALAIFTEIEDPRRRTMALNNMGDLMLRMGAVDKAVDYYGRTAAAAAELGRQNQAIMLINLGNVSRHTGEHETALEHYRKALALAMELGDRRTQVETLIGIGATFQDTGRYGEALIHHERALAISQSISERYEEAVALRHLGETLTASGRYPAAIEHLQRASDLATRIGVPDEIAKTLASLGTAFLHVEGRDKTREYWQEAAQIFESLDLREAESLRTRLSHLDEFTGT